MAEEAKYVFTRGSDVIGYTEAELIQGASKYGLTGNAKEDILAEAGKVLTEDPDIKLAYQLKPLRRLEKIGQDDWTLMNVVDLKGQNLPGFKGEDKAIEIMGEFGMPGDSHILMHYGQDTLEMLKGFDGFQEDGWQQAFDKALEKAPAKAKSGEDLELPRITPDEVSQVVYEPERSDEKQDRDDQRKLSQAKAVLQSDYVQDQVNEQAVKFLDNPKVPIDKRVALAERIVETHQRSQKPAKSFTKPRKPARSR
ncbi:hypothetical protein [Limosilactobacillus mucosae]|uniref:hypothetical protein n=1 Tax=Limosilactobacillus mucosae TaxID=97478 RepID=UPI0006527C19|nr:hypothetical protein [Limosilactobacillus mucosae]